jgi:2-oxoglutarate dehydrogenase E2 component (dihydrolipoamide succinyltransferase)
MRITVPLPVLGDTTQTGVINEWLVEVGAHVNEGDVLVIVESDKAVVDVPSPVTGILVEQLAAPEDEIEIGAPIAIIDDGAL